MAATQTPLCRCCHKNGVFKSLFSDYIYNENEVENYSQMLHATFGILFEPSERDNLCTICDDCIEKLRISTDLKIACGKIIKQEPLIENDVPIKIENCSDKEGPLMAVDVKVERLETANDEHRDIGVNSVLDVESDEDVTIEETKKETDDTCSESDGPLIKVDVKVEREETPTLNDEDNHSDINAVLDEVSNQDGSFSESENDRHDNKCNICNKTFRFKKYLESHIRSHKGYQCQMCPEILSNQREHSEHIKSEPVIDAKYWCIACDATFLEVNKLKCHIKTHFKHRCEVCNRDYQSKGELRKHEMVHKDERKFKCSISNDGFTLSRSLKAHMKTHKDGAPHECQECGRKFKVKNSLLRHRQNMHMAVNKYSCQYQCQKCNKSFRSKFTLVSHNKVHEKHEPYNCNLRENRFKRRENFNRQMLMHAEIKEGNICKKTFKHKQSLSSHMSAVHSDLPPTQCDICKKIFKSKKIIRNHMLAVHLGLKFKCDICKKIFKRKQVLSIHMSAVHLGFKFKCDICKKTFKHKQNLSIHMSAVHSDLPPSQCDICKKTFKYKNNLSRHMSTVHSDLPPTQCDICKKTFKHKRNLSIHMSAVHSDLPPTQCDICKKTFKHKRSLSIHMSAVHSDLPLTQCDICKKTYNNKQGLSKHMSAVHSDLPPSQCDICKKTFKYKSNLSRHMSAEHLGFKLKCDICKKTFKSKRYIRQHMLAVHLDRPPAQCYICKKTFKYERSLRRHRSTVHLGLKRTRTKRKVI